MNERLLKVPEVSNALGVHDMTVYLMIRRGEIAALKVGKRALRIPEAELQRWIDLKIATGTRSSRPVMERGVCGNHRAGSEE